MAVWLIIAMVAGPSAGVLVGIWLYAYRQAALATEVTRWPLHDHPSRHGIVYEEVSFPSLDGVLLRGWYLAAGDDSTCVILIQGEDHHRDSPGIGALDLASKLALNDFSVLLFDLRGRGESGATRGSAGNQELDDTLGAIAYVRKRGVGDRHIALLGFSLGAGLAVCAASREPAVGAVITDSAFRDLLDDYRGETLLAACASWILIPIIRLMGVCFFKSDPGQVRPIRIVGGLRQPILFIHGTQDSVLPAKESTALFESCGSSVKELWLVPGAEHVQSFQTDKTEYLRRVTDFLHRNLT